MRVTVLGIVFFAGLAVVTCLAGGNPPQSAPLPEFQPVQRLAASGDLIALTSDVAGGPQQVTLVDAKQRTMSVYHVDRATGAIALKSVRHFEWDLQMENFNGHSPAPREIRALLGPR